MNKKGEIDSFQLILISSALAIMIAVIVSIYIHNKEIDDASKIIKPPRMYEISFVNPDGSLALITCKKSEFTWGSSYMIITKDNLELILNNYQNVMIKEVQLAEER